MIPFAARLWAVFERRVFGVPSGPGLFNPYAGEDARYDVPGAAALRRENLRAYLEAFATPPRVLLLAEAPGPWGARFSGVPLVSEAQLARGDLGFTGHPTSLASGTPAGPHEEYSARILHRVAAGFRARMFVWNTVPFHPHRPGAPLTIRPPTRREIAAFRPLLEDVLAALDAPRALAVGRVAERALREAGADPTYLRHPSQGGAKLFADGLVAAMAEP